MVGNLFNKLLFLILITNVDGRSVGCNQCNARTEKLCWWAINVGNTFMGIYCNRNAPWLTKEFTNKDCGTTGTELGIKRTQKAFTLATNGSLLDSRNKHKLEFLLPTTFVFACFHVKCKQCHDDVDAEFMMNKLAIYVLEKVEGYLRYDLSNIEPDCQIDEKAKSTPTGATQCSFIIDSANPTAVYTAPLVYNQLDYLAMYKRHQNKPIMDSISRGSLCSNKKEKSDYTLQGDDCFQGLSFGGYFLYCCCVGNISKCSYNLLARKQLESDYFEGNLKNWEKGGEMRREFQIGSKLSLALPRWTRRNYLFGSSVKGLQNTKKLWHCAVGSLNATSSGEKFSEMKLTRLRRGNVPQRTEYCIAYINLEISMKWDAGYSISYVNFDFLADSKSICTGKTDGCLIVQPKCHVNLVEMKNLNVTLFCCCRQHDLCNTDYIKISPIEIISLANQKQPCNSLSYLITKYILNSTKKQDLSCEKYFDQHRKEQLMIEGVTHTSRLTTELSSKEVEGSRCSLIQYQPLEDCINYTRRAYACKCKLNSDNLSKDHYENNFNKIIDRINVSNSICIEDLHNIALSREPFSVCYLAIFHYRSQVLLTDHGKASSKMLTNYVTNLVRRFKASNAFGSGYFIYTCYNKGKYPCNNEQFESHVRHYSARHVMMKMGKARITRYICQVDYYNDTGTSGRQCISYKGCFDLHTVHGRRVAGCNEQISKLVRKNPKLNALTHCLDERRNDECLAVNSLAYDIMLNGIICCCKNSCSRKAGHASSSSYGYHPYEITL